MGRFELSLRRGFGLEKRVHETQFAFVFLWVVAGATY